MLSEDVVSDQVVSTDENFQDGIYEFYWDQCGVCKKQDKELQNLDTVFQEQYFHQLDYTEHRQLAEKLGVHAFPAFFTCIDGVIIGDIEFGFRTVNQIQSWWNELYNNTNNNTQQILENYYFVV